MSKKKAFVVLDKTTEVKVVIFDQYQVAARRKGAEELGVAFSEVSIRRCQTLDQHSPGPVSRQVLAEHGLENSGRTKMLVHDTLRSEVALMRTSNPRRRSSSIGTP